MPDVIKPPPGEGGGEEDEQRQDDAVMDVMGTSGRDLPLQVCVYSGGVVVAIPCDVVLFCVRSHSGKLSYDRCCTKCVMSEPRCKSREIYLLMRKYKWQLQPKRQETVPTIYFLAYSLHCPNFNGSLPVPEDRVHVQHDIYPRWIDSSIDRMLRYV